MSYSEKAGVLTSWSTGRQYRFSRTPDGSGKRQAIQQLEQDDRDYATAAGARAGLNRPLTARELLDLKHAKPKDVPRVISQPVDDGRTNHWQKALAQINRMPARTPAEKSQKRRMLEALEAGSLKFQSDLEAQDALDAMLNDPGIVQAIEHARAKIDRMMTMGDGITESDIADARERLATLEASASNAETHDSAAATYWDSTQLADKAILDRYKARRKEQQVLLADLEAKVKAGEVELLPEVSEPPAAPSAVDAVRQQFANNPPATTA